VAEYPFGFEEKEKGILTPATQPFLY
jgi:hypothetical protein